MADVYDRDGLLVMASTISDFFSVHIKCEEIFGNAPLFFTIPHKKCKRFLGKIFLLF